MAPIPGWYDDPRDAGRLRYWDGDAWTEQVTAKQPAQAAPQWHYPGAPPTEQREWQYGAATPQQTWAPGPGPTGAGPRTPDGEQAAGWGKRLAARLLDLIFVGVGSLPFTGYFFYETFQALNDQLNDPTRSSLLPTAQVVKWETALIAMFIVVYACYETFCLRQWAATPGKRVLEIGVRAYDRPGPLPWPTVLRRVGFMYGLAALNLVPVLSVPAALLALVNYLWPLWDKRRQALHDKIARTIVVERPKPPRASG